MSVNSVSITGNLVRDPEARVTQKGSTVLSFTIAVNDRRKNQQTGNWEDYPNYIDCVMFGARAEGVSKFLAKGMKVAVSGKLNQSRWEKDGQRRSRIEVVVDELDAMSRSNNNSQAGAPVTQSTQSDLEQGPLEQGMEGEYPPYDDLDLFEQYQH